MSSRRRVAAYLTVLAACAGVACAAQPADDETDVAKGNATANDGPGEIRVTTADRDTIAREKSTCPFIGAVVKLENVAQRIFPIFSTRDANGRPLEDPLGSIAKIRDFGNQNGGTLGIVLETFALTNHLCMHGDGQTIDKACKDKQGLTAEVPKGYFSLDFPHSQGAHAGHSGILISGATKNQFRGADNGFDAGKFKGLSDRAEDIGGELYLTRSAIGAYVWANVSTDPQAKYIGHNLTEAVSADIKAKVAALVLNPGDPRDFAARLVAISEADHIAGSAGEFGLLMTVLEVPGLRSDKGEPVVKLSDVRAMFEKKQLPAGWQDRKWSAVAWVGHTTGILKGAECAGGRIFDPLHLVCKKP